MAFPDYYKTLQLDHTATPEQIWLSYHRLAYLQGGFAPHLYEAYFVLSRPVLKAEYDTLYEKENYFGLPLEVRRRLVIFITALLSGILLSLLLDFGGR